MDPGKYGGDRRSEMEQESFIKIIQSFLLGFALRRNVNV